MKSSRGIITVLASLCVAFVMTGCLSAGPKEDGMRRDAFLVLLVISALTLGAAWLWRRQYSRFLTQKLEAEEAVRARENRLAVLMQEANDAILVFDEQFRLREFNGRALAMYGYSAAEFLDLPIGAFRPPEARASQPADLRAFDTTSGACYATIHQRKDGTTFPVEISGRMVRFNGRAEMFVILRDVTHRQRAERQIQQLNRVYAALSGVNQAIVHLSDQAELLRRVCEILVTEGGFKMAWIGLLDPVSRVVRPQAVFGDETGHLETIRISLDDPARDEGLGGPALRGGRAQVCNDYLGDPAAEPWREAARLAGFRSSISLPIRRAGQVAGILSVYARDQDAFGLQEITLLEEAAGDTSFAVDNLERDAQAARDRETLRQSEERFRLLLQHAPTPMGVLNPAGGFSLVNDRFFDLFGYSLGDIPTVSDWWRLSCPDEGRRSAMLADWDRAVAEAGGVSPIKPIECRVRCRDGAERIVELSGSFLGRDILVAFFDLTQRKLAEEALNREQERTRALLENLDAGVVACDELGRPSLFNRAARDFHGLDGAALTESDLAVRLHVFAADGVTALKEGALPLVRALRGESVRGERLVILAEGRKPRHVLCNASLVLGASSAPMGAVAVLHDVTQQHEAESRLRLQVAALNAAANAIMITDTMGGIAWVNRAFGVLTGYTPEETIGRHSRMLKSGVQGDQVYADLWRTVSLGQVWHGEIKNRRKDGTIYDEEMTITPVRGEDGRVTHYIAIKQDITERKNLQEQYLRAQRMESIGLLAGGIAHDLNNVLAPVQMAAEILAASALPEGLHNLVTIIETCARRGADIVKQVLTFARGVEGDKGTLQLRHLVKDMVRMAAETFPRNILIRTSLPGDLWPVHGDATQLHQVLLNLAVNARDAMPLGGELEFAGANTHVEQASVQGLPDLAPGFYVRLEVRDTGQGIAPEVLTRVFEPFFTTKEHGKGTGLGLSTVLGIVRGHKGGVTVASEPGAGTTFSIFLPALPGATTAEDDRLKDLRPQGSGELILLVDDEPDILSVAEAALSRRGYRTLRAGNGVEALAVFGMHGVEVALVVTDIMMPAMDGVDLVAQLRRLKPGLKCIAASGLMGDNDMARKDELWASGVRHFLTKPFSVDQLVDSVTSALAGKE